MKSLDTSTLVELIVRAIYEVTTLPFLNLLNITYGKNISILKSPSIEDKLILLQAITSYLNIFSDKWECDIDNICKNLVKMYNEINITCIDGNHVPFESIFTYSANEYYHFLYNANFCPESVILRIEDCFKKQKKIEEEDILLYKIQIFTFVSFWIDFDSLLLYLYNMYINPED